MLELCCMKNLCREKSGLTLLEVGIGATILLIALTGVVGAFNGYFMLNET